MKKFLVLIISLSTIITPLLATSEYEASVYMKDGSVETHLMGRECDLFMNDEEIIRRYDQGLIDRIEWTETGYFSD